MNNFTATARLTRDPELTELPSGSSVCEMRVAINRPGSQGVDYIDVASYGASGVAAARYLHKGSPVAIVGRIEYREWTAKDGSTRSAHRVVGHVQFLGARAAEDDTPDVDPSAGEIEDPGDPSL